MGGEPGSEYYEKNGNERHEVGSSGLRQRTSMLGGGRRVSRNHGRQRKKTLRTGGQGLEQISYGLSRK